MQNFNYFYIICGESGTGKSTIVKELTKRLGMKEVKSYTTRPKRYETEDTHTFITGTDYEMLKKIEKITMKEQAIVSTVFDNHYYFTTIEQIENNNIVIWDKGGIIMFKLICKYRNLDIPYKVIYITASKSVRKRRMIQRDGADKAFKRYYHDNKAFQGIEKYADFIVYNNDKLKGCTDKIIDFIEKTEKQFVSCDKKETDLKCLSCMFGYDDDGGIYCKFH